MDAAGQLESAEQVECKHADEVEDATDDIEQYNQQLKETEHEIKELEARIALYRGPIDSIRGRLEGRVSAADGDYTGGAESLAMDRRNQRLQDVALYGTGTDMRTLAPVSGSSLALMAAWRGHLEVLEVLLGEIYRPVQCCLSLRGHRGSQHFVSVSSIVCRVL